MPSIYSLYLINLGCVRKIYKYIRSLKFEEKPDYEKINNFIILELKNLHALDEESFEWIGKDTPIRKGTGTYSNKSSFKLSEKYEMEF